MDMQSSIPYYATPLILYHKTIYLSTERCTGIYGNNSGTIIGREVRIFSKLGPLVFVFAIIKHPEDNPSIGLLLCKSKNDLVAEYALKDMSKPIGVSEYKITSRLPEALSKQLPSVEDIQKRIKN